MIALQFATKAEADAKGAEVDAALGYPVAGVACGAGAHVPTAAARTLRNADPVESTDGKAWAYPVDDVAIGKLTKSDAGNVVTLDPAWAKVDVTANVDAIAFAIEEP